MGRISSGYYWFSGNNNGSIDHRWFMSWYPLVNVESSKLERFYRVGFDEFFPQPIATHSPWTRRHLETYQLNRWDRTTVRMDQVRLIAKSSRRRQEAGGKHGFLGEDLQPHVWEWNGWGKNDELVDWLGSGYLWNWTVSKWYEEMHKSGRLCWRWDSSAILGGQMARRKREGKDLSVSFPTD